MIAVDYEVLPHVIDVDEAMKLDAPLLFPDLIRTLMFAPMGRPSQLTLVSGFLDYRIPAASDLPQFTRSRPADWF